MTHVIIDLYVCEVCHLYLAPKAVALLSTHVSWSVGILMSTVEAKLRTETLCLLVSAAICVCRCDCDCTAPWRERVEHAIPLPIT